MNCVTPFGVAKWNITRSDFYGIFNYNISPPYIFFFTHNSVFSKFFTTKAKTLEIFKIERGFGLKF